MAYGMKYTKGGFPFKSSPATYEKNPQALVNRKAQEKYDKTLPQRISVDNPEHAEGAEHRAEALMNDHDVDENGVAQTGAAEYNEKTGKSKKSKKTKPSYPATPEGSKQRSKAEQALEKKEDEKGY